MIVHLEELILEGYYSSCCVVSIFYNRYVFVFFFIMILSEPLRLSVQIIFKQDGVLQNSTISHSYGFSLGSWWKESKIESEGWKKSCGADFKL